MASLLLQARQSLETCAALGLPGPGEAVKEVVDITRIPSRTAPLEVLLWPPLAPLPNPASTLPPAFLQFSRERGDEGRRIGEQAAAARRGR